MHNDHLASLLKEGANAVNGIAVPKEVQTLSASPTKGLTIWSFLEDPITLTLSGPGGNNAVITTANNLTPKHVEFGLFNDAAHLDVKHNGNLIKTYKIQAGALTESLDTDIPPIRNANTLLSSQGYYVSIGIYDAPHEFPSGSHQCFINVTRSQPGWIGTLPGDCPFWALCLPGAHDAGMNTTEALDAIQNDKGLLAIMWGAFLTFLGPLLGPVAGVLASLTAKQFVVYAIWWGGLTQKDSTSTMLNMGIRYFDFRPGHTIKPLQPFMPDIRHQHSILPGQKYVGFLTEVLTFLKNNPTEIVLVNINFNGFVSPDDMTPTQQELAQALADARNASGCSEDVVKVGGPEVFKQTLQQIWSSKTRLLITNSKYGPALSNLDAWNDKAWATLDPNTILGAYKTTITAQNQQGRNQTTFQAQATATDAFIANKALLVTMLTANNYDLPLTSTKGQFNAALLPYIQQNEASLNRQEHLVIQDDWADGCLVEVCIGISKDRYARRGQFVPS